MINLYLVYDGATNLITGDTPIMRRLAWDSILSIPPSDKKGLEWVTTNLKPSDIVAHYNRSPFMAKSYARLMGHRIPEIESIILQDGSAILDYARDVIKGRWRAGERVLLSGQCEAADIVYYAKDVIKGRWREGEERIADDASASLLYAREVLRSRFPAGETNISNSWAADDYNKFIDSLT